MIAVDTSAVVAIIRDEPEGALFSDILDDTDQAVMSVVSYVEINMVISGRREEEGTKRVGSLLSALGIQVVPVTIDQGVVAVQAFLKFGKGRHPAGLNLADCFTYALAKSTGFPLLFKGKDFPRTDIVPVAYENQDQG